MTDEPAGTIACRVPRQRTSTNKPEQTRTNTRGQGPNQGTNPASSGRAIRAHNQSARILHLFTGGRTVTAPGSPAAGPGAAAGAAAEVGGGDDDDGGGAVSASAGRCPGPKLMDASEMRGAGAPSSPGEGGGRLKV